MPGLEELLTHPGIWRGREAGSPTVPARPSGHAQLDQALQGGWPRGQLTELIGGPFGSGETRILLPMLAACTRDQRRVVLVGPPATPWIPGWRQLGVDPELVLMIRTATEEDAVWSCEQILRQPDTGALLAWLRGTDGAPLRRLRLAASAGDACAFLYRPPAAAQQPSPAHLRIRWQGDGDHLRLEVIKQTGGWLPRNQPVMIPRNLLNHRCEP
ncbi:translesion DNA synthesis-associated protein ImuA [Thioalkalivibrio sp.]|uniref:translesion DNA synthesis-associated protein ImuA n=1 Tax=Thioalkalivibrio sp. TaxID=2093813 RepID=UPI0012D5B782|nr:translesion DNA synthesis-associated protein ImuA [Thioalkalivibrio sp.]TVP80574.1 MAG: translesion DNA synthesis-associated protein ImuA [Thioalkalivibrio sp.]